MRIWQQGVIRYAGSTDDPKQLQNFGNIKDPGAVEISEHSF